MFGGKEKIWLSDRSLHGQMVNVVLLECTKEEKAQQLLLECVFRRQKPC
jgi:hypothetical protein